MLFETTPRSDASRGLLADLHVDRRHRGLEQREFPGGLEVVRHPVDGPHVGIAVAARTLPRRSAAACGRSRPAACRLDSPTGAGDRSSRPHSCSIVLLEMPLVRATRRRLEGDHEREVHGLVRQVFTGPPRSRRADAVAIDTEAAGREGEGTVRAHRHGRWRARRSPRRRPRRPTRSPCRPGSNGRAGSRDSRRPSPSPRSAVPEVRRKPKPIRDPRIIPRGFARVERRPCRLHVRGVAVEAGDERRRWLVVDRPRRGAPSLGDEAPHGAPEVVEERIPAVRVVGPERQRDSRASP